MDSTDDPLSWKCASCTFINNSDERSCRICYKYVLDDVGHLPRSQLEDTKRDSDSGDDSDDGRTGGDSRHPSDDVGTTGHDNPEYGSQIPFQHDTEPDNDDEGAEESDQNYTQSGTNSSTGNERDDQRKSSSEDEYEDASDKDFEENVRNLRREYPALTQEQVTMVDAIVKEHGHFEERDIVDAVMLLGSTETATVTYLENAKRQRQKDEDMIHEMVLKGNLRDQTKARLAVELMSRGHTKNMAIMAARQCSSVEEADRYLCRTCPICMDNFPHDEMFVMLYCQDACCYTCTRQVFTKIVREKSIRDAVCPICGKPDLNDPNVWVDYFGRLLAELKNLLDGDVYDLFQTKLRDFALEDGQCFWCPSCKSGFFVDAGRIKTVCPKCKTSICFQCREIWLDQHNGLSCDKFKEWKRNNNIEWQTTELEKYLNENGIVCPKCKTKYALSRGGCIHFSCRHCKHEFCGHCNHPFYNTSGPEKSCPFSAKCHGKGLHAHHPRNCHYYMRDYKTEELRKLLDTNGVSYDRATTSGETKCPINMEKEIGDTLKEELCGDPVEIDNAGVCSKHYVEYLTSLIMKRNLDPTSIMEEDQLLAELARNFVDAPVQERRETDPQYRTRLINLITNGIDLENN